MSTHAISSASLICLGQNQRARLMRELDPRNGADHATEFLSGMYDRIAPSPEQDLAKGRLLVLERRDLTVVCLAGELWLTRDGDIEDYILGPGQSLRVVAADQAMVQALQPSRVRIVTG